MGPGNEARGPVGPRESSSGLFCVSGTGLGAPGWLSGVGLGAPG